MPFLHGRRHELRLRLDEDALRDNLEELLHVYKELLEVAMGERQAIANEMSQITQAQKAAKVYHLFG